MALLTAACSSDEMALNPADQPAPVEQKIPFTAVISADAAGTRALTEASDGKTITAKWEKEEKVALIHGSKADILKVASVDATTGAATITGDITSPTDGESVFVVYAGHGDFIVDFRERLIATSSETITEQQISQEMNSTLGSQDGTLEGISDNFDFRLAKAEFTVKDNKATFASEVKMPASYAIWKLNLTTDGTTALKAKQLSMQRKGDEEAHAAVDLGTETSSEFYLAFIPSTQANAYTFEAITSDEKTYSCTPTVSSALAVGKYYRSTLKMEAAATGNTYRVYTSGTAYTDEAIPSDAVTVTSTTTTWAAGTYLVSDEVTIANDVTLSGDVNLILKDGASLTISGTIGGGGNTLNIYGQKEGTGELSAKRTDEKPIAITAKNLNVHGGKITVPSSEQGIETGGTFTIYNGIINSTGTANGIMALGPMNVYGGEITAKSTEAGPAISLYKESGNDNCNLTISGGKVTATNTGSSYGIYNPENIIITGGTVEATGEEGNAGISAKNINISGGTVTATGNGGGEGILCISDDASSTITIDGGTVISTANGNAGVGLEGSIIIINDGDVTATGGNANEGSNSSGGAGIDGTLTVNGGTVTATSGVKDGTGSDCPGISGGSTVTLGAGIKFYEGDAANSMSEASVSDRTKRYSKIE